MVQDLTSHNSCVCVLPSTRGWAGCSDPLLLNRIGQKQWNVPSEIRLQKDSDLPVLSTLLCLSLACSDGSHLRCVRDSYGKERWRLPATNQWGTRIFSAPTCEELTHANNRWVRLRAGSSSGEACDSSL